MKIKARLREMATDEIAQMIEPDRLAAIKLRDPHPLFKAFVVGHEGESEGKMVGIGNVVKRWFRDAVEQLHNKIAAGLQLFHGHGETNDHAGRQPIGEVVGKRAMKIGERLSSVVACYIYPDFRHLPLDVASVETNVTLDQGPRGLVVAQVDDVTGIALGNSHVNRPGFAGATLLGQLQAFAERRNIKENLMDLTLEDVQAYLKQEKLKPSDVFAPNELSADPLISEQMREKSPSNFEFARMRRELSIAEKRAADLEREKSTLEERSKAQDAEISASRLATAKNKVGQLFEQQKMSRKLDDRQTKFIQNRLARFTPQKPDEVDKEFVAYLDAEIDEYGKIAKDVFGIEPAKPPADGGGGEPEPVKKQDPGTKNEYLDPAKNPMIKLV